MSNHDWILGKLPDRPESHWKTGILQRVGQAWYVHDIRRPVDVR